MATENFYERHCAVCSKCGAEAPRSNSASGSFISHFFLPNMCAECGSSMSDTRWGENHPHWIHRITKMKRVAPPARRWGEPSTWFQSSSWVEESKHEYAAR